MVADFSRELVEDMAGRIYGADRSTDSASKETVRNFLKALAESPLAQKELGLRFGPQAVATRKAEVLSTSLESIREFIAQEGGFEVSPKVVSALFDGEDYLLSDVEHFGMSDRDTRENVLSRFAINLGYGVWPYNSGLAFERAQYDAALVRLKEKHDSLLTNLERR